MSVRLTNKLVLSDFTGTLWDDQVSGFFVTVRPSGRKVYGLYYRNRSGDQRKPTIGEVGKISLDAARAAARSIMDEVAAGRDPAGKWAADRKAATVADLVAKYKEAYKGQKAWRDKERHIEADIVPTLGATTRVTDLDVEHVQAVFEAVAKRAPVQANRVTATLSHMLSKAEKWKMRPLNSNPCTTIERTPEKKRRRKWTSTEAMAIARELKAREALEPASVAFIYLLIYTGARKGEIAAARWEWLDGNVLRLPDSKTGQREIYLPPQVVELLDKLPRRGETLTGVQDPKKLWDAVRDAAGCGDLRMHDLRRTFASAAISAGFTLDQIGKLLGHKSKQTTDGYAWMMEEAAVAVATITADRLDSMMSVAGQAAVKVGE